ncbi:MAG: FmdB family zinc ribbon protein [Limnochordia bacterium]|jgi:putative FmdB family regulatory protein|nr:FmdB family transcriptional regulator [Bacillota bacterium]
MPTYEYKCAKCGRFEFVQKITAAPLSNCPTCGGKVRRLISSNVNIIFKGPGFYCTDNRKPEPKAAESSSDKAS